MNKMRVSDAIRKGAKTGPQVYYRLFDGLGGSCVMGAFMLGLHWAEYDPIEHEVPWNSMASCPVCPTHERFLHGGSVFLAGNAHIVKLMIHLNNDHRWTREAIADWYEDNFELPREKELVPVEEELVYA